MSDPNDLMVEIKVPPSPHAAPMWDDRHPNPTQNVLSRLRGVRSGKDDKQWSAYCPAHDDCKGRSLSLGVGRDGRVLIHCHAGGELAQVVRALGLEVRDLFVPGSRGGRRRGPHAPPPPRVRPARAGAANWEALARDYARAMTDVRRAPLAFHLGLPDIVFSCLPVGFI